MERVIDLERIAYSSVTVLFQARLFINMVRSFTLAAAAALLSAPLVSSHYILNIRKPSRCINYIPLLTSCVVMHNGKQIGGEYTYVRKNSNTYMPSFMEIVDSLVFPPPQEHLTTETEQETAMI